MEAQKHPSQIVVTHWIYLEQPLFVAASHQTGLDTKSMTQRLIKVGIRGWEVGYELRHLGYVNFADLVYGFSFLVVVDARTEWLEIPQMQKADTCSTIALLKQQFSQHGLPKTLVPDNRSQFTSEKFHHFCSSCCILHVQSLPYHPQSNGQAERLVNTFKHDLLKAKG